MFRATVLKELEHMCSEVTITTNSRAGFKYDWCFSLGYSMNTLNLANFTTPHPLPKWSSVYGVCLTDPLERSGIPPWKKGFWRKAQEVLKLLLPELLDKTYAVQFSKMSSPSCSVPFHYDRRDVSWQYALFLGDYEGAFLEVCDPENEVYKAYSSPYCLLQFDGRLRHRVRLEGFWGVRYSVIFYQQFDLTKTEEDPIFFPPSWVY